MLVYWLAEQRMCCLLLQVNLFFQFQDFQTAEKKSAKNKFLLFCSKPQTFHTAKITSYTLYVLISLCFH